MNGVAEYSNKTLSIRISTNGFCFCTYEATAPESIKYFEYATDKEITLAANFEAARKKYSFLAAGTFKNISIIIDSEEFTTIPTEYEGSNENMFRCCFPQTPVDSKIISNRLTAQGITVLFAIEKSLYDSINTLGTVTYYAPISIILGYLAQQPLRNDKYLFVNIHKGRSLILSMEGSKLQLSNSFSSSEESNHIYYILSIWQECGLSQVDDKLYICGGNSAEGIILTIEKFIRHIERINPNELFRSNLLNKIENIPFDLQALLLCE